MTLLAPRHHSHRVAVRVPPSPLVDALALDVWSEDRAPGDPIDVVVDSDDLDQLVGALVLVDDIDAVAAAEHARIAARPNPDFFGEFRTNDEVTMRLRELSVLAPGRAALEQIGTSVEGRPIWALRVGRGPTSMVISGTQHAREWIATMTSTCVADRLVREYGGDRAITELVDRSSIWIVPVVNPDGYEFAWTKQRYWRKNRRDGVGVDLNRNWSVAFGGAGSSGSKGSEVYRGPRAFSEPESAALRDLARRERVVTHIDFHSYSQLILYPWAYQKAPAKDRARFLEVGAEVEAAILAQHGLRYTLESGADLYPAAGTATDWMYGEAGALSFTIELRPKGGSGFVLPPSEIKPTCDEGLAAVLALGSHR